MHKTTSDMSKDSLLVDFKALQFRQIPKDIYATSSEHSIGRKAHRRRFRVFGLFCEKEFRKGSALRGKYGRLCICTDTLEHPGELILVEQRFVRQYEHRQVLDHGMRVN